MEGIQECQVKARDLKGHDICSTFVNIGDQLTSFIYNIECFQMSITG